MNFNDIFRKAATLYQAREAVKFADKQLNYGQLFERSCRLANALASAGVRPGDRVATLGENLATSVEEITGLALGGFVRSPMYTQNTVDIHSYMLNLTEARALIVQDKYWRDLAPYVADVPTVQTVIVHGDAGEALPYEELLAQASSVDPNVDVAADDLAIIRFSAGTTGRPKGIAHTQAGWLAMGNEYCLGVPPIQASDRQLVAGPMSHASGLLVWPMIANGASHVIMPSFDAGLFLELVEAERCTRAILVPTMIQLLVDHPDAAKRDLSSLTTIYYGAAPITERTLVDALRIWGNIMYQLYGQSECLPISVLGPADHQPDGTDRERRRLRSAGRPFPNVLIKIVGDDGSELPLGEVGEIVARSPGGMKEIWRDPDATKERMTADGWVWTRDIGSIDGDGFLYISDRKEDMIISGGFNVWPAEIENVLYLHPAVLEACVIGVPHDKWGETPKAVVVLRHGMVVSEDELIAWCRERVGGIKKPTSVVLSVESLPRSPVGKVTRRLVREKFWGGFPRGVAGA